jgi:hypothetical protein
MLEGLIQEGLSSRGEMTDTAIAVQAECAMPDKGPTLAAGSARSTAALAEHRVPRHLGKRWPDLIAASFRTREVRI